jgi:mannosyltransferase OCH1-like enzyme
MLLKDIDQTLLDTKGKLIHQIWFGTIPNKRVASKTYGKMGIFRDSWKNKNPDWKIIEWDKGLCMELVKTFYPEHVELFNFYKYEIQKCDAIRYFILHRYGGWYVDMDYYCNRKIEDIHDKYNNDILLVETPNTTFMQDENHVSNSLMYSVPNNSFWKTVMIELERNRNKSYLLSKHIIVMYTTGPGFLNRVYYSYKDKYNIRTLPWKYFHPYGITDDIRTLKLSPDIYTAHINKGTWSGKDTFIFNVLFSEWQILLFIILIFLPIMYMYYKERKS